MSQEEPIKKKINSKDCAHHLREINRKEDGHIIEITSQCEKCGVKLVEEYRLVKGYIMDANGRIIEEFV